MRSLYRALFAFTLFGGSAAAWFLPVGSADVVPLSPGAGRDRNQAIAFYQKRLVEDPHSALDMAQLAALLMEQGRATGDESAFARAESLSRHSLGERQRKNGRSAALLTNALLAQHRFAEATEVARTLVNDEPDEPAYRALFAEALMEIGDYDRAIRHLSMVREQRTNLGIAPRFARWAELTGRIGEARRILREIRDEAATRLDLSAEQRAWFSLRLADLELRYGNHRSAAVAIERGLEDSPGDWRLLLTRARLEAGRRSWRAAARYAEEAMAAAPTPEAFALLATTLRHQGKDDEADALDAVLEGLVQQSGVVHRTWAFALLERGRSLDATVSAVAADTLVRQDVHTLDLLAWALHRAGRSREALPVIRRAMRMGSVEPSLRYHAGMIEWAAGDPATARSHLDVALGRRHALSAEQVTEIRHALTTRTVVARN
jgi:tetratricopeptide (TPR) repeat protein